MSIRKIIVLSPVIIMLLLNGAIAETQSSHGDCSPNVGNITGDITIDCKINEQSEIKSIHDIGRGKFEGTHLPPDTLEFIKPGINFDRITHIFGPPDRSYDVDFERDKITGNHFNFSNATLRIYANKNNKVDHVILLSSVDGSFEFPLDSYMNVNIQLGVSTWGDAEEIFNRVKPVYEYAGRWTRIYIGDYFGMDGGYMSYLTGSTCELPDFSLLNEPKYKSDFISEVKLTGKRDVKLNYIAISSEIDPQSVSSLMPICY